MKDRMVDCKTAIFGRFRKAQRAVSAILTCEARGEKTTVGFSYNEFVPTSSSNNVTKVSKIL